MMRPTRPYVEFVRLAALAYYVLAEFVDPKREGAEAVGRAVVGQTRLCAFVVQRASSRAPNCASSELTPLSNGRVPQRLERDFTVQRLMCPISYHHRTGRLRISTY